MLEGSHEEVISCLVGGAFSNRKIRVKLVIVVLNSEAQFDRLDNQLCMVFHVPMCMVVFRLGFIIFDNVFEFVWYHVCALGWLRESPYRAETPCAVVFSPHPTTMSARQIISKPNS